MDVRGAPVALKTRLLKLPSGKSSYIYQLHKFHELAMFENRISARKIECYHILKNFPLNLSIT